MPKFMEQVAVVNSAVRTLIGLIVMGVVAVGSWFGYSTYYAKDLAIEKASSELALARSDLERKNALLEEKEKTIDSLHVEVEQKQREIDRLDTAIRLLKVNHRIARLSVIDQAPEAESGQLMSLVEFQELNDEGMPLEAPKQFRIRGDVVYVDAWVVKFDDKYVEQADIDRNSSLVLFRRIFGEHQKPLEGFSLDEAGARPAVYGRGNRMSELEKKIWGDFWSVANDEQKQAELGIRTAHGEAPFQKVEKGKSYRIEIRSSGGLSFDNEADVKKEKPAA
jgi:cell division protein FtsB